MTFAACVVKVEVSEGVGGILCCRVFGPIRYHAFTDDKGDVSGGVVGGRASVGIIPIVLKL